MTMDPDKALGTRDWAAQIPLTDLSNTPLTGEVICDYDGCKSNATQYIRTACPEQMSVFWYCDYHMTGTIHAIMAGALVSCDDCGHIFEDLKSISKPRPLTFDPDAGSL